MTDFEKFKEEFPSKEMFHSSLKGKKKKKIVIKSINMFLRFGINLKWKWWKIITTSTQNVLLLANVFETFRNINLENYA